MSIDDPSDELPLMASEEVEDLTADELLEAAEGFEAREETTSPEVFRGGRQHEDAEKPPVCVIGSRDPERRDSLSKLLTADGWTTIGARGVDEVIEQCRARHPQVVLVDPSIRPTAQAPVPHLLRRGRDDDPMRVVALLDSPDTEEVAGAVADGFDDFIIAAGNHVEILARAAANLRACRSMALLRKQRRDAASLLELSQALASSLDLQLILHTVSRLIAEVIELERCSIVVLDPDRDDAVMVAASEDRTVRDLRIKLSNYPELKRCVQLGAPVLIEDTRSETLLDDVREMLESKDIRAMALFPIVFEERVTGVLFLRSTQRGRRFADHEIQFGQTVASACAVAIRNARLFEGFKDQTEQMNYRRIVAERQMEGLKKYEDFFEYAADGMAIVDKDANILYVNGEGRKLLGRDEEDLRKNTFLDFLANESQNHWPDIVDQVRRGRYGESFDLFVVMPDATERIFWLSAGGGGQDTGLLVLSFRDVTETREMELELRTTKEFLENLIDNSVDAIVAADMSGNVMLFNKGAEELFGYTADDVIGQLHVSDLYPSAVAQDVMRQLRDDRWGGRGRLVTQRKAIVDARGEVLPVSMTASVIYEDGEEVATVGVLSDLRERLKIERRLSEAQDELMKSERARVAAQLAGMAAHELNQPLTSVLGYAEMMRLRVDEGDRKLRKPIDTIFEQAERMAKIVRKIGQITRYETKHYGAGIEVIDLEGGSQPERAPVASPQTSPLFATQTPTRPNHDAIVDPSTLERTERQRLERQEVTDPQKKPPSADVEITGRMMRAPGPNDAKVSDDEEDNEVTDPKFRYRR